MSKETDTQALPFEIGNYKVLSQIGEGGMGKVFKALDVSLQRTVAIKLQRQQFVTDHTHKSSQPDTSEELEEARRLARLNHPNIVQVYELLNENGRRAIVMEYLEGETLLEVKKQRLLSVEEKLDILLQIVAGMEYVHQNNLLHADLKPDNVFITHHQQVKILDFGISQDLPLSESPRSRETDAVARASISTLTPELLAGRSPSKVTDIYTFGNLAFWLFTDHYPPAGRTIEEKISSIRTGKLQKASELAPQLSAALSEFLQLTLALDPKNRPEDFAVVKAQLQRIQRRLFSQTTQDEKTLLLEELTSGKQSKTGTFRLHFWLVALVVLGSFGALLTNWFTESEERAVHFVLVLTPRITPDSEMPPNRQNMITAVIDNALRNAVLNTRHLNLIAKSEFNDNPSSAAQLAKITGATDIVQSFLDCSSRYCEITFERLDATASTVLQRFNWHLPVESTIDISEASRQNFYQLFPDSDEQFVGNYRVSEKSFEEYIAIYQSLEMQAGNTQDNYVQLKHFINKEPHIWLTYRLFRVTALKLYLDSGDIEYLNDLESLLQQAPPEYRNSLFYTWDAFMLRLYQRDFASAGNLLEQAQQRGLDPTTLAELRATYYLKSNQPAQAKSLYEFVLATRFSTVNLYNLALCHWYLGETQEAKQRLETMLTIAPDDYGGKQLLASVYLLTGELPGAIAMYQDLIQVNPESRDLSNLSLALLLSGDLPQALNYARNAASLSPGNTTWRLNLADIEKLSGNNQIAMQLYENVLTDVAKKEDLDSLLLQAQAYIHLGQSVPAIKALNQAYKLSPENGEVAFVSALVYTLEGEYASALVKVEQAINADVGAIWFTLPWFRPLCNQAGFTALMQPARTASDNLLLCVNTT